MVSKAVKNKIKKLSLYHKEYKLSFANSEDNRLLNVMLFNGSEQHGGLVDRFKGIISTYLMTKKSNGVEFKLAHFSPYDLRDYLVPNQVDWSIKKEELIFTWPQTKVIYHMDDFDFSSFREKVQISTNRSQGQNHFFTNIDFSADIRPKVEPSMTWRQTFEELFRPSSYLLEKVDQYDYSNAIGIHARFASLLGDFKDTTKKILTSQDDVLITIDACRTSIERIMQEHPTCKFFLFSDSGRFTEAIIKAIPELITTEGRAIHIDTKINKQVNDKNHDKTWIDFFLLTKCQKVYQVKTVEMYDSQFSRYAATIGHGNYEIVHS